MKEIRHHKKIRGELSLNILRIILESEYEDEATADINDYILSPNCLELLKPLYGAMERMGRDLLKPKDLTQSDTLEVRK